MRALKILVVGMGVLIVVGTVALVVMLVQRSGRTATRATGDVTVNLPPGNRILGLAGLEGRLAVWVEGPEGSRILLLEGASGRQVGEIRAR